MKGCCAKEQVQAFAYVTFLEKWYIKTDRFCTCSFQFTSLLFVQNALKFLVFLLLFVVLNVSVPFLVISSTVLLVLGA